VAELIYSAITSLDGYVEDQAGSFDWAAPDEEVLTFLNDVERPVGTYLYGRRMYETMVYWESAADSDHSALEQDWMHLWRAADKIVYSRSLESAPSAKTRIERTFDPIAVRALKESLEHDLTIGGPELAARAFRAGLVDRCQLYLTPVLVGGGKPALPTKVRLDLELIAEHRFAGGVVFLDYRVR
jgi:dihydrofolate reductase